MTVRHPSRARPAATLRGCHEGQKMILSDEVKQGALIWPRDVKYAERGRLSAAG